MNIKAIKEKRMYERMTKYIKLNSMGVSRDTQLRILKLLKVIREGGGRKLFEFGHDTMKIRWKKLIRTLSLSKHFPLQKIVTQCCMFFRKPRNASLAYAWVKREEDKNCYEVLIAANIQGRKGRIFHAEDRYVRLSLVRSEDDFDLMIQKLNKLVLEEQAPKMIQKYIGSQ